MMRMTIETLILACVVLAIAVSFGPKELRADADEIIGGEGTPCKRTRSCYSICQGPDPNFDYCENAGSCTTCSLESTTYPCGTAFDCRSLSNATGNDCPT